MKNDTLLRAKVGQLLVPSFGDAIFVIFFFGVTYVFGQKLLGDGDTGYHIRAGEYIINTLAIPRYDMFSFIAPPLPWTAHEWLTEVIMAALHAQFGLTGVVFFYAGLIALLYSLLFRMLRRSDGFILIAMMITLLAVLSSVMHWLARPHIFSLLLLVVWYDLLDSYHYRGVDRLYLLPLLMLLWVNLHGGFISGFILLGIYLVGNLILSRFGAPEEREAARRRWRRLLSITFFCLAASLVNPFGYHILLFPFKLVSDSYLMDNTEEFMSPNFHDSTIVPFKLLLLMVLALLAASRQRLNIIELALMLFFVNMALFSVRYIPLFAIIAVPISTRLANRLLSESKNRGLCWLKRKDAGYAEIDAQTRGFLWPVSIIVAMVLFSAYRGVTIRFDEKLKPVAAVEFLKKERIPGNMFDNDEFGDYIIYAAWPRYRVFIDGRLDMYGAERVKEYIKIRNTEAGWESVMKKYDMNWVIFDAPSPLCRYLLGRSDWRLIYADKVANIFVRDLPIYQPLIRKYPAVKPVPHLTAATGA